VKNSINKIYLANTHINHFLKHIQTLLFLSLLALPTFLLVTKLSDETRGKMFMCNLILINLIIIIHQCQYNLLKLWLSQERKLSQNNQLRVELDFGLELSSLVLEGILHLIQIQSPTKC